MNGTDETRRARRSEKIDSLKAISTAVGVFAFVFGVVKFLDQQKHRDEQANTSESNRIEQEARDRREARKQEAIRLELRDRELSQRFREEQFTLYQQALEAASALALHYPKHKNRSDVRKAWTTFWSLYWGKLALVESQAVVDAMVAFGKGLARCQKVAHSCETCLSYLSLALAHRCRESVSEPLREKLPKLPEPEGVSQCMAWAAAPLEDGGDGGRN